jgi:hypothetical protein
MGHSIDPRSIDPARTDDLDAGLAELRRCSLSNSASERMDVKLSDQSSGWQELNRRHVALVSQISSEDGSTDECPGW